ncbi:hypothetical protein VTL71DRAFT_1518 [Oculimacula yallundae]|uniref:Uncharacterized protein n=1 Tax=Oculimacula yallundae TaxID=86028 RepID=A0ABR4CB22_9HELO
MYFQGTSTLTQTPPQAQIQTTCFEQPHLTLHSSSLNIGTITPPRPTIIRRLGDDKGRPLQIQDFKKKAASPLPLATDRISAFDLPTRTHLSRTQSLPSNLLENPKSHVGPFLFRSCTGPNLAHAQYSSNPTLTGHAAATPFDLVCLRPGTFNLTMHECRTCDAIFEYLDAVRATLTTLL